MIDENVLIKDVKKWQWDKGKNQIDPDWADMWIKQFIETIKAQPKVNSWIPFKLRKADDEEKEMFHCDVILDCPLPDDEQEILVTYKNGYVDVDTFLYDSDGCYLDSGNEFVVDVIAWMPKPEGYKGE